MRYRMRKAANDDYWERGVRLAVGTLCAVVFGGIGAVLLVGHLLAGS